MRWIALTAFAVAAVAAANEVVPTTPPHTAGAGISTRPIVIERRNDAGTSFTAGALTVMVSSSSPSGQFEAVQNANSGWLSGPVSVSFAAGEAAGTRTTSS